MAEAAGLSSLLENKLFMQYLSGAGGAISAGQPAGPALNEVTQKNITAQNFSKQQDRYMKILQGILSGEGEVPEGAKMTRDAKGTKFEIPSTALSMDGGGGGEVAAGGGGVAPAGDPGAGINKELMSLINPSSSQLGGSSASDLAGLTPQDISNALKGALSVEALKQQTVTDAVDMQLKQRQIESLTPSITIPGTDIKLTNDQYLKWYKEADKDERTAAIKNFEYAKEKGFSGSFEQFQDNAKTTHKKDYDEAKSSGYKGTFNEWMLEMAKAGATTIGDITGREKAKGELEGQMYFKDPKWTDDVDEHMEDKSVRQKLMNAEDPTKAHASEKVTFIENRIMAGGGTIESIEWADDGKKVMIWTVKWPSGDTEKIRHGIRN